MLHVFLTDIRPLLDRAVLARAERLIPAVRRGSIRMIPEVRARVIGADLLLAYALKLAGADLRSLRMEKGPHEKPYFADAPQLHFNISHSGDYAMCILSDREAGCDVEHMRKERVLDVAGHFYHRMENALLEKVTGTEAKLALFTRIWTLKESYIKVTGLGLSQSLREFAVLPQPDGSAKLVCDEPDMASDFVFHHCSPADGYMCSYALEGTGTVLLPSSDGKGTDLPDEGNVPMADILPDPQLIDIMAVIDSLSGGNI